MLTSKRNRTIYRNLLGKKLEKGKGLLREAEEERYKVKVVLKNVTNCVRSINDLIEGKKKKKKKKKTRADKRKAVCSR